MPEIDFLESIEAMPPAQDSTVDRKFSLDTIARFFLFLGQQLLYSALILLAVIFLTYFELLFLSLALATILELPLAFLRLAAVQNDHWASF